MVALRDAIRGMERDRLRMESSFADIRFREMCGMGKMLLAGIYCFAAMV